MRPRSFLTEDQVRAVQREFGTPVFVYDQRTLEAQAKRVLGFPNAYGLTARYAMKALPTAAIIRLFHDLGLRIDASSGYEAERAMRAGVPPEHIQVTAQELPRDLEELLEQGVLVTACSLHQLAVLGGLRPGREITVRINPGLGSGHSDRTNTGGPSASFGIWHEHLDDVFAVQREHGLRITGMHTHIGSGADPEVWNRCAQLSLGIAARLPEVTTLGLGGGFKVARMSRDEEGADLATIGATIKADFDAFANEYGRRLKLEIEPGTYLVANAGALVCTVIDVVDTGADGYDFIKVDSGMTEIARPAMYGAQHPLTVVPAKRDPTDREGDAPSEPPARPPKPYLVAGHCCESGDVLTPAPGNPEGLHPRLLAEPRIGDALVVGGAGAYCAAMSSKNYNSFPEAAEVLLERDGAFRLIRERQTLDQMVVNELAVRRSSRRSERA